MLYGQYTTQINADKAFILPESFISHHSNDLFVTKGFDRNLIIMPEEAFAKLYQRITSMNMADPLARLLLRLFLGSAEQIPYSDGGEVVLSEQLSVYAELLDGETAILVGQGDHIEIWALKYWEEQNLNLQDASKNAYRFSSLDLSLQNG